MSAISGGLRRGYRQLLRQAVAFLEGCGYDCAGGVRVRLMVTNVNASVWLCGRPQDYEGELIMAERPREAPTHWRWFSELEEAVVRAADDTLWRTAEELAAAVKVEPSNEFRAILKNLVDRGVLLSARSRGYRRNEPAADGG